jgi:hypothetical protein
MCVFQPVEPGLQPLHRDAAEVDDVRPHRAFVGGNQGVHHVPVIENPFGFGEDTVAQVRFDHLAGQAGSDAMSVQYRRPAKPLATGLTQEAAGTGRDATVGLDGVWKAYGKRPYARMGRLALTFGGEGGGRKGASPMPDLKKQTPRQRAQMTYMMDVKVTLDLEADVLKFFKSMGEGYGPRINDVLKSYMHARLAGVIRGAETLAHYREREEGHSGGKPQFGDVAKAMGGEWEDAGPGAVAAARAWMQEMRQKREAEGEARGFGGPLVR